MKFLSISCTAALVMLFQLISGSLFAAGSNMSQQNQQMESKYSVQSTTEPTNDLSVKIAEVIEYQDTITYGSTAIGDSSVYNLEISYLGDTPLSITNFEFSDSQFKTTEFDTVHFTPVKGDAVPKTGIINIDGVLETAWNAATTHQILNTVVGSPVPASDLSADWRAMWNDDYLYIAIDVTDEQLVNNTEAGWSDDVVEIHIDGDNSKYSSYDDVNDVHILMQWNDDTVYANLDRNPDNIDYTQIKFATVDTPDGYRMECAIPWSEIGVSVAENSYIGFDVHVGDDDGSERETKISWYSPNDDSYYDPTTFGTIQLGSRATVSTIVPVTFQPVEAGNVLASLQFVSIGLSTNDHMVQLIGEASNLRNHPVLHISNSILTDTLLSGEISDKILHIQNLGALPLDYILSKQSNWLSIFPEVGNLVSEGAAEVLIRINSAELEPGAYSDTIRIYSTDPDNRIVKVTVDFYVDVEDALANNSTTGMNGVNLMNYPNPVETNTTIVFNLNEASDVGFSLISVSGSISDIVPVRYFNSGRNEIQYNASDLKKGIYFLQMQINGSNGGGRLLIKK